MAARITPPSEANSSARNTKMVISRRKEYDDEGQIPMFPTTQPPRADEDTATIEQVMEQVPGEIELDRIIKAQTSGPQIAKRMVELENSIWPLVGALLLLPEATRVKIGATDAIAQARLLIGRSMVLDHNLELPARKIAK